MDKFRYFRETLLWPLADDLNFEDWLGNFKDGFEREIAQHILNFFIYVPDKMIDQMLSTVIGKCGYYLKQERGLWSHDDFKRNCFYSFIQGETPNPTDSGYLFTRKLRDVIGIPEAKLLEFKDLHSRLSQSTNMNVILVDDFVGTGCQTIEAWTQWKDPKTNQTMQEIVRANNHKVVYAPLIVNYKGYERIQSVCTELKLVFIHYLDETYSLFHSNCPCWGGDEKLYNRAVDLISNKSLFLDIPSDISSRTTFFQGFDSQGLALAFHHGIPDASLPIFYWKTEDWKPLIKKEYPRPY